MDAQVLTKIVLLLVTSVVSGSPGKLLRVPKIYNALITSKEKILPSEAHPGATGPIFQPVGLTGAPIIIQPEIIAGTGADISELFNVKEGDKVDLPFETSKRAYKSSQPVAFFPRYSIYYPHQLHLLFHQPFAYESLEIGGTFAGNFRRERQHEHQEEVDRDLANEERKDLFYQKAKNPNSRPVAAIVDASAESPGDYVKNNRPLDRNIPDIPPPPPPIRYKE